MNIFVSLFIASFLHFLPVRRREALRREALRREALWRRFVPRLCFLFFEPPATGSNLILHV
jgi:hypothetical protein